LQKLSCDNSKRFDYEEKTHKHTNGGVDEVYNLQSVKIKEKQRNT
jgi:hypothetical protein